MQEGRGVDQLPARTHAATVRIAHDQGRSVDGRGELVQALKAARHEIIAQEKIARRITAKEKFRRQNELGAAGDCLAIGRLKAGTVSVVVADGGVKLQQANAHGLNLI
jgi:hypothetical protein